MSAAALNLEAITKAIEQHNQSCKRGPASEVQMNPFEVDRLGWDEIKGIPITGNPDIGTGRFRVICSGDKLNQKSEEITEAVADQRELQTVK